MRLIMFAAAGLVVGLVLLGQAIYLIRVAGSASQSVAVPAKGTLSQRLDAALTTALGSSDRGVRRYRLTAVRADRSHPGLKDVAVTWAINKDISQGTVGNGARLEVYTMLNAIYSAHLPVAMVRLTGTYRISGREQPVMRLSMDRHTMDVVAGMGWDTVDPQTVWALATREWVSPDFQPLPGD